MPSRTPSSSSSFGRLALATLIALLGLPLLSACDDGGGGPRRPDSGIDAGPPDSGAPVDGGDTDGGGETCGGLAFEVVVSGLDDPVQLIGLPGDDRLFIVERAVGRIRIHQGGSLLTAPFLDLSAGLSVTGDQGLLGLAFHPDFGANGRFFVAYSPSAATLRVSSFEVNGEDPNLADPSTEVTLLEVAMPEAAHTSGHLTFGPDGYLYIGVGDGQNSGDTMGLAQDTGSLLGKILRIDVDATDAGNYGIPADNPFVGDAGARGEVWALGFRLPYRFSFSSSGELLIGEVGDTRFEEVNYDPAGSAGGTNYGWPRIEGEDSCHTPSSGCDPSAFTPPIRPIAHSGGFCAVMGGFVYEGTGLDACHRDRYYYSDYCTGRVFSFGIEGGAAVDLLEGPTVGGMPLSWGRDGDGEIYLLTMNGVVQRLVSTP